MFTQPVTEHNHIQLRFSPSVPNFNVRLSHIPTFQKTFRSTFWRARPYHKMVADTVCVVFWGFVHSTAFPFFVCLSVSLSVSLSEPLSLPVSLSLYLSPCLSLSLCLSLYLSPCLSLSLCLSGCLSVCLSVCHKVKC